MCWGVLGCVTTVRFVDQRRPRLDRFQSMGRVKSTVIAVVLPVAEVKPSSTVAFIMGSSSGLLFIHLWLRLVVFIGLESGIP